MRVGVWLRVWVRYLDINASSTRLGSPRLLKMLLRTLIQKQQRSDTERKAIKGEATLLRQDKTATVTDQPLPLFFMKSHDGPNICYCLVRSRPCTCSLIHMDGVPNSKTTVSLWCLGILTARHVPLYIQRNLISELISEQERQISA